MPVRTNVHGFDEVRRTLQGLQSKGWGLDVKPDHGSLLGLADDDHLQYLRADSARELTKNWDAGRYNIRSKTLESDVAIGTAPLVVASTTLVTNFNADLWDGFQFSDYLNQAVKTTSSPTFANATISTDLTVSGELKGARCIIGDYTRATVFSNDVTMPWGNVTPGGTDDALIMPHAGSIIGHSVAFTSVAGAGNNNVTFRVYLDGVVKASLDIAINATPTGQYSGETVVSRGTVTFTAGQAIHVQCDFTGAGIGNPSLSDVMGLVEVQFNA